ncbi:Nudix family hydrolase [Neptuniibacter sp. UBA6509]|uniref:Nudix family hydrolase n=2 Tax=unclassified Neptuniibacter TaxID=2630693 RepID=UPI0025D29E91|nr:Nudix family hydrolase [Neptuniibacter sp. UBA6509]|tara:strand:+ start:613 stop:1563 length:951 start_codon:yes stop_codon:yes gene_type:complete
MSRKLIHVAAAVIQNSVGDILIAKRSTDKHQGGLWEFPGGKVEEGESALEALSRELYEELGVEIDRDKTHPLIKIPHHYSDKSVLLDVFQVNAFSGNAWGKEGQPVKWVSKSQLDTYEFPAANRPILNACMLPSSIAITPVSLNPAEINSFFQGVSAQGAQAIMLRNSEYSDEEFRAAYSALKQSNSDLKLPMLVNCSLEIALELGAQGLHLSSERLKALESRSEFSGRWLSASCHDEAELEMAVEKGLDFVTLSPLLFTTSHPEVVPLGWERFQKLVSECTIPVFALGGLDKSHIEQVVNCGGQGIAAISCWVDK